MASPNIETERLILSRLRAGDAPRIYAYRHLPEVYRYQGWRPQSLEDAESFVRGLSAVDFDTPGTWYQFGLRLRDSDQLVGDLGVHFFEDGEQVELGVTLAPEFNGKGLATEALIAVIEHLFGPANKHRVTASIDSRNEASTRLMERVGMRREAHFRESVRCDDEWADDLVFAMLSSEWPKGARG
jgi:RimJ/RimL family protein N-acetyltransferase